MFERFYPWTSYAIGKLAGPRSRDRIAISREVVHPAETGELPGIDISERERRRITGTGDGTRLEVELARLDARPTEHMATIRHEFRNVIAGPAGIYSLSHAIFPSGRPPATDLLRARIPTIDAGFHSVPPIGLRYFGHWLVDGLTTSYLRREHEDLFLPYPHEWNHARDYVALLGLSPVPARYAFFRSLSVCTDIGMNADRRARMRRLSRDIRGKIHSGGARRVFLSRGRSGVARELANERQIADLLKGNGFVEISVSAPLAEIHEALHDAEVCVSMEGSHVAHAVVGAPKDALMVLINPADRFITLYAIYTPALNIRLAYVVCERQANKYVLDPADLTAALSRNGIDLQESPTPR